MSDNFEEPPRCIYDAFSETSDEFYFERQANDKSFRNLVAPLLASFTRRFAPRVSSS